MQALLDDHLTLNRKLTEQDRIDITRLANRPLNYLNRALRDSQRTFAQKFLLIADVNADREKLAARSALHQSLTSRLNWEQAPISDFGGNVGN